MKTLEVVAQVCSKIMLCANGGLRKMLSDLSVLIICTSPLDAYDAYQVPFELDENCSRRRGHKIV